MLSYLHIQNLAIADDLEISFSGGFNVMTGETGAGKSIVVDAVGLLSGGRAYRELIRTGADRAVVEGLFTDIGPIAAARLIDLALPRAEEITIKRIIQRDGPSRALVNGELVTQAQLQTLGRDLVEIHSQNDQQMLLSPENHLGFLDAYGRHTGKLENLAAATGAVKEAVQAYSRLLMDEREKNQRIDMLKFQIREIETAAIQPDELTKLTERKLFLRNTGRIQEAVKTLESTLNDGESDLSGRIGKLVHVLRDLAQLQPRFQPYMEPLQQLNLTLIELERDLSQTGLDMEEDGPSLDEIETRLVEIERILRKYGEDYAGIQGHLAECRKELSTLEELEFRLKEQGESVLQANTTWLNVARSLSDNRRKAGRTICRCIDKRAERTGHA